MQDADLKHVTIYTDGACTGNPGKGGWAAVLLFGDKRKEISGGFRRTTNNRMELKAPIEALCELRYPCKVTLRTDSSYVANGIQKGWAKRWRANGWMRHTGDPAINADLWAELLELCERHVVKFEWLRGHAGDPDNEWCDQLAVAAAKQDDLPNDAGYKPSDLTTQPTGTQPDNWDAEAHKKDRVTKVGHLCRKCGTPVESRQTKQKPKPGQQYSYDWYLVCPSCSTMYMVDAAKRMATR